jgi:putative flippase GtrA
MNFIKQLLSDERVRFLLVGGFNTGFGFVIYAGFTFLFRHLEFGYMLALIISQIISLFVAFALHKKVTFKKEGHLIKDFIRFAMVNSVSYLINLAVLPLLVHGAHWHPLVAQFGVLVVTTLISFVGHKYFSFKR